MYYRQFMGTNVLQTIEGTNFLQEGTNVLQTIYGNKCTIDN